jgi:CcmD family protein
MANILNLILLQAIHSSELPDASNSGKLYVVVAVMSILFLGITVYLIRLDRKLAKIEKA